MNTTEDRHRFDLIDKEQMAAQIVALMGAHFQRPSISEKLFVLKLAAEQVRAGDVQSFAVTQLPSSAHVDHST